jgi:protein-tyrosine phosphatase
MTIRSRLESVNGGFMTEMERTIITQNADLQAYNVSVYWDYPMRHDAQKVTPWLYVGPRSVIKEKRDFLEKEGITKIVILHESALTNLMGTFARNASQSLGIECDCVIADSALYLIRQFPDIFQNINAHLVKVYQDQAAAGVDGANIKRGKVLVVCQTGNDRANVVAAAYLMATYSCDMAEAVQFVCMNRFCCDFNEDSKRALLSWGDIIGARSAVRNARVTAAVAGGQLTGPSGSPHGKKRTIHETESMDEDRGDGFVASATDAFTQDTMDAGRFLGREAFKPFVEVQNPSRGESTRDQMEF